MILPDFATLNNILLRQATIRVMTVTLTIVTITALLAVSFQQATMDKTANQVISSLERFYGEKLILIEQDWQEMAIKLHNRLELRDLFNQAENPWQPLQAALDQESNTLSSIVLITNASQQVLFKQAPSYVTLPTQFNSAEQTGWHQIEATNMLYYWVAQPLWLGSHGNGHIILFVPIENSLLFRLTLPFTDLFLLYQQQIIASSLGNQPIAIHTLRDGTTWEGRNRLDQTSLLWNNTHHNSPKLIIRQHSQPIFSTTEIIAASIGLFIILSFLLWQTLGTWLINLTHRISLLGWVAQEFAKGNNNTPDIQFALTTARKPGFDEITTVADALANATKAIADELQARQTAQINLQKISSHNKFLLEAAGEGIYGLNTQGITTFINPAAARMLGWQPEELIGRHLHQIMHHTRPDNTLYPQAECLVDTAICNGITQHVDNELFWRKDGTSFPVEYTSTPILNHGKILGAVVVFRDISERIQAEKQAQHYLTYQRIINGLYAISYLKIPLQEQLDKALNFILSVPWLALQAKCALFIADPETETLTLTAHSGLDIELVIQCQHLPYGHCLCGRAATQRTIIHAHCIDERHDIHFDGMLPHGHYSVPILSGQNLLGVLTFYLQPDQTRHQEEESLLLAIGNTLGSLIERKKLEETQHHQNLFLEEKISERTTELQNHLITLKKAQTQLIQSERLAALGGLVAGISHEIKTPVGIGFTAITYLETETTKFKQLYQQGELQRETLDHYLANVTEASQLIKANLQRASELILSFKQVAVDQTSQEKRVFYLKEYLEEIVFTLRPKLKKTQHKVIIHCAETIKLNSHPGAISQIIANFILNSLTYAFDDHISGEIKIQAEIQNKNLVCLHYQDNGKGMLPETQNQIYEPFFTTNRNQGGSGLGMHIVYNLITQRLNGTIECRSTLGKGTEFFIQFPIEN